jgi:ferredoxin-NADP reductase
MSAVDPGNVAWQEATIERIVPQTPSVKSVFLRPTAWRPFFAGQHVDIRLTAPDGYQAQRSYSIASAPEAAGAYELAIEKIGDGEVSPYFHDVAEPSDTIEVRGPVGGHFVWHSEDGGPVLLIGGGSGVAPLMSMLRHRAAQGGGERLLLVHAARAWDDVLFREELVSIEATQGGVDVLFALSRDTPRRPRDHAGRIDEAFLAHALDQLGEPPRSVFVCGSNPFVEAVTAPLLRLGVPPGRVRTERYGG